MHPLQTALGLNSWDLDQEHMKVLATVTIAKTTLYGLQYFNSLKGHVRLRNILNWQRPVESSQRERERRNEGVRTGVGEGELRR